MRTSAATTTSSRSRRFASGAATAAAVLFGLHLVSYLIPALRDATLATAPLVAVALATLAIAQHLVVFPVVPALPAPRWAQLAAYLWLVVDMATDLLQAGGASKSLYLTLRLAINVVAALWIASASWSGRGAWRVVGLVVAADLVAYSLTANLDPRAFLVALPSLVLLPLWFALAARRIARASQSIERSDRVVAQVNA